MVPTPSTTQPIFFPKTGATTAGSETAGTATLMVLDGSCVIIPDLTFLGILGWLRLKPLLVSLPDLRVHDDIWDGQRPEPLCCNYPDGRLCV